MHAPRPRARRAPNVPVSSGETSLRGVGGCRGDADDPSLRPAGTEGALPHPPRAVARVLPSNHACAPHPLAPFDSHAAHFPAQRLQRAETWDNCLENTALKLAYGAVLGGLSAFILFRAPDPPRPRGRGRLARRRWHLPPPPPPLTPLLPAREQELRPRGPRCLESARAWAWAWVTPTASTNLTPSTRRWLRARQLSQLLPRLALPTRPTYG